jgi:hypothetical protein
MQAVVNAEMTEYILSIAGGCPDLQSIWLIGSRVHPDVPQTSDWDFLAFGSTKALECLRQTGEFHRSNVDFLVVTNGNDFENAWGPKRKTGSLSSWQWRQHSEAEAKYVGAKWVGSDDDASVERKESLAVQLWQRGAQAAL